MYFTEDDLKRGIYPEVLQVLTRVSDNVSTAIDEAVEEVRSYLCARYDLDAEFQKTGTSRSIRVMNLVREIAIYNCYKISNPVNMPEIRQTIYSDTIKALKSLQGEKASIPGLVRLTDKLTGGSSYIKSGGNTPRHNHY